MLKPVQLQPIQEEPISQNMKPNDRQKCQKGRSDQELHSAGSEPHTSAPGLAGFAGAHLTQSFWVRPEEQRRFTNAHRSIDPLCVPRPGAWGNATHLLTLPTRKTVPGRRRRGGAGIKRLFDSPQPPPRVKSRAQIVLEKARRRSGVGACHRGGGGVGVYSNPGEHTEERQPQPGSHARYSDSASYRRSAQLHLRSVSSRFFILEKVVEDDDVPSGSAESGKADRFHSLHMFPKVVFPKRIYGSEMMNY